MESQVDKSKHSSKAKNLPRSQVVQLSLGVRLYTEHPIHMQTNVIKLLESMNIIIMSGGVLNK